MSARRTGRSALSELQKRINAMFDFAWCFIEGLPKLVLAALLLGLLVSLEVFEKACSTPPPQCAGVPAEHERVGAAAKGRQSLSFAEPGLVQSVGKLAVASGALSGEREVVPDEATGERGDCRHSECAKGRCRSLAIQVSLVGFVFGLAIVLLCWRGERRER